MVICSTAHEYSTGILVWDSEIFLACTENLMLTIIIQMCISLKHLVRSPNMCVTSSLSFDSLLKPSTGPQGPLVILLGALNKGLHSTAGQYSILMYTFLACLLHITLIWLFVLYNKI